MLLTILFASLPAIGNAPVAAPFAAPAGIVAQPDRCPALRPRLVHPAGDARARRLGDLPPGRLELAVHREVDGCPIPAVLREGMGGVGARAGRR